jgi:hypothetical protein
MDSQPSNALCFSDVVHRFEHEVRSHLPYASHRVLNHIKACRTADMGGRLWRCDRCQRFKLYYHSCRDRHCPTCGYQATLAWQQARLQDVLPVTYHHLVFTLPHALNPWVESHPRRIYQLFYAAVWATLKTFGQNPRRLNGEVGAMVVLHTWGQTLTRHVHLHCLIPGGALGKHGCWKSATSTYLFPVRALSRHVRGRMVSALRAVDKDDGWKPWTAEEVDNLLDELMSHDWVVYSKPVLTQTDTVIAYLARYTKRIGISNTRLVKMDDEGVWFRYQDYRSNDEHKVMRLSGVELLRRFLLHVLPKGFMRVRYYGFMANVHRRRKLVQIRVALAVPVTIAEPGAVKQVKAPYCAVCRLGILKAVAEIRPNLHSPPFP